jgi:hypothetical protein
MGMNHHLNVFLSNVDIHADARNMKEVFENETFDCVIDKGTLDSILVCCC